MRRAIRWMAVGWMLGAFLFLGYQLLGNAEAQVIPNACSIGSPCSASSLTVRDGGVFGGPVTASQFNARLADGGFQYQCSAANECRRRSGATDAVTSATVCAIEDHLQNNITDTDCALGAMNSAGGRIYRVLEDGTLILATASTTALQGPANWGMGISGYSMLRFESGSSRVVAGPSATTNVEVNGFISAQTGAPNGSRGFGFASGDSDTGLFSTGSNTWQMYAGNTQTVTSTNAVVALPVGVTVGGGAEVTAILSATATLDFPSAAVATCDDLTITVTGAADGNVTSLGVPNAAQNAVGSQFTSWVSASNTVTVRHCCVEAASCDPGSGTFRSQVTQF